MSHSAVLVIGHNVEALLEPFDENLEVDPYWELEAATVEDCYWVSPEHPATTLEEALASYRQQHPDDDDEVLRIVNGEIERYSTYNPDSRWDWYAIGGRWSGRLKLRPGCHGEGEGEPETWNHEAVPPGYCNRARKGDLDLEGMRETERLRAEARWEVFEAMVATHGPLPDDAFMAYIRAADFAAQRDAYWEHPTIKAIKTAGMYQMLTLPTQEFGRHTRESYCELARLRAVPGYALLTPEGEWLEQGRMGWFGADDSTPDGELAYLKRANQVIDDADDDALFTVVDVHI